MPELNLKSTYLAIVRAILREYAPDAVVWAYGSRVKGDGHEGSDLDLVVRHAQNIAQPVTGLDRLREAFKESNLPILVDVQDWSRLPESFQKEILAAYVEL